jgi:hypothetical protein
MLPTNPEDRLFFVRDRSLLVGDDAGLRRRAARGELRRINHGVYATNQDCYEEDGAARGNACAG